MKSWPKIEVAAQPFEFPPLQLAGTKGKLVESTSFTSYVCGITPYDATHLGHAATYLTFDLINRYELISGKKLNFIENITDIDDPLFERAKRDNQNWETLGLSQIDLFRRDMTALRILPPKTYLAVTETIDLVLNGLQILNKKGAIYRVDDDFYFDIAPYLVDLPVPLEESLKIFGERGGDPDRAGKRHALDPLVWRKNVSGEPGWESEFGYGRPGWHIECSVIAIKGAANENKSSCIDLQGGGNDLIFPHHFMSAAIAEAISGKNFADIYVHAGMIGLDGEKMSKSKGNLVFVHKLLDEGWDPMVIRFALMDGDLFADRMWSNDLLTEAKIKIQSIQAVLSKIEVPNTESLINRMIEKLSENLNTKSALNELLTWCAMPSDSNGVSSPGTLARFLDSALGLAL